MSIGNMKMNMGMTRELRSSTTISSPAHYWHDRRVVYAILRYLGGAGTSWHEIESIDAAYLAIIDANQVNAWGAMARPIAPATLEDEIVAQHGLLDLSTSLWHKDDRQRPGYPRRTLLVWDIDWFGTDAAAPFHQPCRVLRQVEPVLEVLEAALADYGIAHLSVVTGRGAHLVTAIPARSSVMDELIQIGNVVEPTVLAKQAAGTSPWATLRGRPVPMMSELSFKGAARLQQFLITQQIRHARQAAHLPVEISDIGGRGSRWTIRRQPEPSIRGRSVCWAASISRKRGPLQQRGSSLFAFHAGGRDLRYRSRRCYAYARITAWRRSILAQLIAGFLTVQLAFRS